jgi:DMSO/TMAO reductase YedYZ molybdopterin-dependent catalytic subunit
MQPLLIAFSYEISLRRARLQKNFRILPVPPVRLDPQGYFRRVPLAPERLTDRITATPDAVVLCHLGVPRLGPQDWSLTIDGMVGKPRTLQFDDLLSFPKIEVASIHQCAGSPLQPFEPMRRICNVVWSGARLIDVLAASELDPAATFLWSYGLDWGTFSDVGVDAYLKDLPRERIAADTLIAYEMNGKPLPAENGFPARLVVPGFYGTNSVKWLTRMTLADRRADSPFTTRWYNDPVLDENGAQTGETRPVWSIAPESLIVAPAPDQVLAVSIPVDVWGWAWADGGVERLEIATSGDDWRMATLEAPAGRHWQRFALTWTPSAIGHFDLASRATARNGLIQPDSGRRNAIYRLPVTVV